MAIDEGLVQILRDDLADARDIEEKRMFGGICFMWRGHMLCGISKAGGMFRVGKEREQAVLGIEGVREMDFTGRRMDGMVETTDALLHDDARREAVLALARGFIETLPPK